MNAVDVAPLTIASLAGDYRAGRQKPADVVAGIFARIREEGLHPVWISLASERDALARAAAWDPSKPLAGIPFAVKDNIDVEGLQTTAGCPSFGYLARRTATVVQRLLDAGAILIGKTNMDQFATGLVGVRSPYGACSSVFDERYISGGSSSGSAVAVARGLCAFALGTDTAGSGRIPAAFNHLVGLKPTRGLFSTEGVVPACRSLDCVSVFAATIDDAAAVGRVVQAFDPLDPLSRAVPAGADAAPWLDGEWRFGVPRDTDLEFFGDAGNAALFKAAVDRMGAAGGRSVTIDFTPFKEVAALLYSGPWVAERYSAVGEFLSSRPADADPIVTNIILSARKYSADDVFRALERLAVLRRRAEEQWAAIDVMLVPTAGTTYTKEAVAADPIRLNTNLGYYTNFVNLLDLAAVAVPAGLSSSGLPFGVSIVGPAFSDAALLAVAERFHRAASRSADAPAAPGAASIGCVRVAVVGAHLSGEPLNPQLVERGARLVSRTRTSSDYKLFALAGPGLAKPGLLRVPDFQGPGIEVEVWSVPAAAFGTFVALVPPPLAIGSLRLADGSWVKGFVCEPVGLEGAQDITSFGGWKAFRSAAS